MEPLHPTVVYTGNVGPLDLLVEHTLARIERERQEHAQLLEEMSAGMQHALELIGALSATAVRLRRERNVAICAAAALGLAALVL